MNKERRKRVKITVNISEESNSLLERKPTILISLYSVAYIVQMEISYLG